MKTISKDNEGSFDAIKMMRAIRDEISLEIMHMSYNEERAYLDILLSQNRSDKK